MNISETNTPINCEWSESQVNFDRTINSIEDTLTAISTVPFLGIISSVAQAAFGVLQTHLALWSIMMSYVPLDLGNPPPIYNDNFRKHAFVHIKHGLGNILAIFKGIPFVGTIYITSTWEYNNRMNSYSVRVLTGYEYKDMAYPSLVEKDWKIGGTNKVDIQKAQDAYNKKILDSKDTQLTLSKRMKLAQKAIFETISAESLMMDMEINREYHDYSFVFLQTSLRV
jgi:hypothetical protein